MSSDSVLRCEHLSKTFKDGVREVRVLSDVSISVQAGDTIAIMGASGSGKSTLMHCMGGLDLPSDGVVKLKGHALLGMSEVKKSRYRNQYLGFVYQFHHLLPEFNALENVMMPLLIRREGRAKSKKAALELIDSVGLSQRALHRINELSGGERQRIAIARALVTKPACVLADEPTGNLDHDTAFKVTELLLKLNQEFNTAFVVVTHNPELARSMAKQYTLVNGKLS